MYYIGMDCHINSLDFALANEVGWLVKAIVSPPVVMALSNF